MMNDCRGPPGNGRARPRRGSNLFGIQTGRLGADGSVAPWTVEEWSVVYDLRQESYLAFGPEDDTGEMKYRVAVRLTDLESAAAEPGVLGEVLVVRRPDQVDDRIRYLALAPFSDNGVLRAELKDSALLEYRALLDYGACAPVYHCAAFWGDSKTPWPVDELLTIRAVDGQSAAWRSAKKRIEEEAAQVYGLLGFYLDRPVNRLGTPGWEMLGSRRQRGGPA